jgi:hypothetical protein
MSEGDCELCRILFAEASAAISSHVGAVSALGGAVSSNASPDLLDNLEEAACATGCALEMAVERYQNHRSAHELKVMVAGS